MGAAGLQISVFLSNGECSNRQHPWICFLLMVSSAFVRTPIEARVDLTMEWPAFPCTFSRGLKKSAANVSFFLLCLPAHSPLPQPSHPTPVCHDSPLNLFFIPKKKTQAFFPILLSLLTPLPFFNSYSFLYLYLNSNFHCWFHTRLCYPTGQKTCRGILLVSVLQLRSWLFISGFWEVPFPTWCFISLCARGLIRFG